MTHPTDPTRTPQVPQPIREAPKLNPHQTPKSEMVETLTDAADRFLKWVYKQPYSGPPVISIPRHDGNIDAILADAATRVAGLEAENARLTAALSKIAEGTAPPEPHGHYLAHRACVDIARAALKPEGGET